MTPAASPDFDRCAASYEEHAAVQRATAAWLAEWLPATIDGPALELGAGTGLFTRHLVPRTGLLTACDIAPRMVRTAARAFPAVSWHVAGATEPPGDRNYRWIFSCSLAQWLDDPLRAFRAWHRSAAPEARLVAGWFVHGTLAEFLATCPAASPFAWRDTGAWLHLLAAAGWQPVRHDCRHFIRHHRNTAAMLREIHNVGAVIPRRFGTGRLRRALRHHDQTHGGDQGIATSFVFLRVEAVRS